MDHEKQLAAVFTALGATSHEEALAMIATQKKAADALAATRAELETARGELAKRDAAAAEKARADVLAKHEARGALTPAMKNDATYMGDLAGLSAEALDRVLAKLPGAHVRAEVKNPAAVVPGATGDDEPTAEELANAAKFGISAEAVRQSKKLDRERAAKRGIAE